MRSPFRKSQDYTFEPVFTPQEAIDKTIVWDCNDTSIISIEQNGTITALAIGEVNITATLASDNTIQASAIVIVDREIAQIVVGGSHSVILDTKGDVWVAGGNENGQLGIGNNDDNPSFVKAKYLKNVKSIAAGKTHTLALDDKGEVWVAGSNSIGQIGIGALEDRNNFSNIMNSVAFKAIAAGARHSLALDNEGNMWATGSNSNGQLGIGDTYFVDGFVKVSSLGSISRIAAGYHSSFAIRDAYGFVWATGDNTYGQLGTGDTADKSTFRSNGVSSAISAAIGSSSAYILDANGYVWASGYNASGDLGIGSPEYQETSFSRAIDDIEYNGRVSRITSDLTNIVDISAGYYRVLAADSDGALWTTGANNPYFPIDTSRDQYYKDMCMYYHNYPPSHEICESKRSFNKILNISGVKSVAVSDYYALAVDTNGSLWATGINGRGQLGFGDVEPRFGFEKVPLPPLMHVCPDGYYYNKDENECRIKVTNTYYVNGINNTEQQARHGSRLLQDAYIMEFLKDELYKNEIFLFDYAYNYSKGFFSDLIEVIAQKTEEINDPELFNLSPFEIILIVITKANPVEILKHTALIEAVEESSVAIMQSTEADNLSEMLEKFRSDLAEGYRVVLVAHSQGNMFATQAMELYNLTDFRYSIGMIGVASPAGHLPKNTYSSYWTGVDDKIINGLRKFSANVMPANVDNDTSYKNAYQLMGRDMFFHGFEESYFHEPFKSRAMIDRDLWSLAHSLRFPKEQ